MRSFDGHTFWKSDSISISDDDAYELGIFNLFKSVILDYNEYSEFEIDMALWNCIKQKAQQIGGEVLECILEADQWVEKTYLEYEVFTIIGV